MVSTKKKGENTSRAHRYVYPPFNASTLVSDQPPPPPSVAAATSIRPLSAQQQATSQASSFLSQNKRKKTEKRGRGEKTFLRAKFFARGDQNPAQAKPDNGKIRCRLEEKQGAIGKRGRRASEDFWTAAPARQTHGGALRVCRHPYKTSGLLGTRQRTG
jgi:hypothetical protein